LNGALPNLPDSIYGATTAVYDMVYQSNDTVFIEHAKGLGCEKVSDGLGMLVGQAAESFYLWFSVRPDVEPVLVFLRKELAEL
jgi:shikimate dehydrogenase